MEGCALFLLDWLIEGPGGYLETNPSTSPEHMFVAPDGQPASVSYSSTMDMSIIREVFSAVVSASEVSLDLQVATLSPPASLTFLGNDDNSCRCWEKVRMIWLKRFSKLNHVSIRLKLPRMGQSWNG